MIKNIFTSVFIGLMINTSTCSLTAMTLEKYNHQKSDHQNFLKNWITNILKEGEDGPNEGFYYLLMDLANSTTGAFSTEMSTDDQVSICLDAAKAKLLNSFVMKNNADIEAIIACISANDLYPDSLPSSLSLKILVNESFYNSNEAKEGLQKALGEIIKIERNNPTLDCLIWFPDSEHELSLCPIFTKLLFIPNFFLSEGQLTEYIFPLNEKIDILGTLIRHLL